MEKGGDGGGEYEIFAPMARVCKNDVTYIASREKAP